ncbi:MAG: DNA polymerase ligase N-terminal domain-containing protein [Bacillota bacterium]
MSFPKKLFVIQKHKASNLHFDFRLKYKNVLISWAIPRGPSLNPEEKRLAIAVEDHDPEHAFYEDEYCIVWDKGNYFNITGLDEKGEIIPLDEAINNGVIEIILNGKRLKGGWNLIRVNYENKNNNWLLIKKKDRYIKKGYEITEKETNSVISNKKLNE